MHKEQVSRIVRRHKERLLLLGALAVTALTLASILSAWLEDEAWGPSVTVGAGGEPAELPVVELADFGSIWEDGGRNPFGEAGAALEFGGKAKIPRPPLPPLRPERPPAPMVRPIDLLMGASP